MLLVDKPAGPTSHDVVAVVRRSFQTRRAGHTGTLDPFATGLLVVLLGRATRLARFLVGLSKEYVGTIRLGAVTTTDDRTGDTLRESDAWQGLSDADIVDAMKALEATTSQRPPRFSAKSVDGRRAYRRARQGEEFELAAEPVTIERFGLVSRDGPDLVVSASVDSGVYIRSLARDLGERLGCGAHLAELRRTRVGPFTVNDAVTLDRVADRQAALRPVREAVAHLASIQLGEDERAFVRQGRRIPGAATQPGPVALLAGSVLVAVAESDGETLQPSVVLETDD
jgi:tRNA pseudouridine55 synthase